MPLLVKLLGFCLQEIKLIYGVNPLYKKELNNHNEIEMESKSGVKEVSKDDLQTVSFQNTNPVTPIELNSTHIYEELLFEKSKVKQLLFEAEQMKKQISELEYLLRQSSFDRIYSVFDFDPFIHEVVQDCARQWQNAFSVVFHSLQSNPNIYLHIDCISESYSGIVPVPHKIIQSISFYESKVTIDYLLEKNNPNIHLDINSLFESQRSRIDIYNFAVSKTIAVIEMELFWNIYTYISRFVHKVHHQNCSSVSTTINDSDKWYSTEKIPVYINEIVDVIGWKCHAQLCESLLSVIRGVIQVYWICSLTETQMYISKSGEAFDRLLQKEESSLHGDMSRVIYSVFPGFSGYYNQKELVLTN